jgi:hypothetical protein
MRYELADYEWIIALAIKSNGSSIGSNNVVVWRRATTGLRETILPSSNSLWLAAQR